MNRRAFLASLAAAFALDPERALWTPGKRMISIPSPNEPYLIMDMQNHVPVLVSFETRTYVVEPSALRRRVCIPLPGVPCRAPSINVKCKSSPSPAYFWGFHVPGQVMPDGTIDLITPSGQDLSVDLNSRGVSGAHYNSHGPA